MGKMAFTELGLKLILREDTGTVTFLVHFQLYRIFKTNEMSDLTKAVEG